ncbi:phage adaptor protein [Roseomonas sp. WA12]
MTLAEVRAMVRALLNRDDCTPDDEDRFLSLAVIRIQRDLRAPLMERVQFTDATTQSVESVNLPADFLQMIEVMQDDVALDHTSYRGLRRRAYAPPAYARFGNVLYFHPPVPQGSRVEILYYGEFSALTGEADANELTQAAPDLLVYGALSYAGDHFEHDKRVEWEARFTSLLGSVQEQANADEFSGGPMSVQAAYPGA